MGVRGSPSHLLWTCMRTHMCERVCTSKRSEADGLVVCKCKCQDPEIATGQMMCRSPAAGGIHFLHMYMSTLADLHPA